MNYLSMALISPLLWCAATCLARLLLPLGDRPEDKGHYAIAAAIVGLFCVMAAWGMALS